MSSWTTTLEGAATAPRFFVGSRDDEVDFLGSDVKMAEIDFFEDDEEEEEGVRSLPGLWASRFVVCLLGMQRCAQQPRAGPSPHGLPLLPLPQAKPVIV